MMCPECADLGIAGPCRTHSLFQGGTAPMMTCECVDRSRTMADEDHEPQCPMADGNGHPGHPVTGCGSCAEQRQRCDGHQWLDRNRLTLEAWGLDPDDVPVEVWTELVSRAQPRPDEVTFTFKIKPQPGVDALLHACADDFKLVELTEYLSTLRCRAEPHCESSDSMGARCTTCRHVAGALMEVRRLSERKGMEAMLAVVCSYCADGRYPVTKWGTNPNYYWLHHQQNDGADMGQCTAGVIRDHLQRDSS